MRIALLSVLVVAAVAVGLVLWSAADAAGVPPTFPSADAALTTAPAARLVAEPVAVAGTAREDLAAVSEAPPAVPDDATLVEVTVVDAATDAPVPGAEVVWMDQAARQRMMAVVTDDAERVRLVGDGEAMARRFGWQTRADERGVARVHVGALTMVLARYQARFGMLTLAPPLVAGGEGHRVLLEADHTLRVQMLDASGDPAAEVPVALLSSGGAVLSLARTESDSGGLAVVPHLQRILRQSASAAAPWTVRPNLPGLQEPGVAFDPAAPPADAVVLHLPPCGGAKVRVDLGSGEDWPASVSMVLFRGAADDFQARNQGWYRAPDADGWVRFPWLPLGGEYRVSARLGLVDLGQAFAGPRAAGEEVTVRLAPTDSEMVLTGRLLDARGQLLREQPVEARVVTGRRSANTAVRTDAQGRFCVLLGEYREGERLQRLEITYRPSGSAALSASVAARPLLAGEQDLGDVALSEGGLVVAGSLVTDAGPYRGQAGLLVERREVDGRGRESWQQVEGLVQEHDPATGVFAVRGEVEAGRYRLVLLAWKRFVPVDPVEFSPGTRGLEVRLDPGSSLAATVLLLPSARSALRARLVPARQRESRAAGHRLEDDPLQGQVRRKPGDRSELRWSAVAAGRYALELRAWGEPEPLHVVEDVVLPPPDGGDPRLVGIDLRDEVVVLRLAVVGGRGEALPARRGEGMVFRAGLEPGAEWPAVPVQDGAAFVVAHRAPVDLTVAVSGFRPRTLRGLAPTAGDDAHVVSLEPWPEVELVFEDVPSLPEGVQLAARVVGPSSAGRGSYRSPWSMGSLRDLLQAPQPVVTVEGRSVRVAVGDGRQRLALWLRRGRESVTLPEFAPGEITVTGGAVPVRIPQAAVDQALAALSARAKK